MPIFSQHPGVLGVLAVAYFAVLRLPSFGKRVISFLRELEDFREERQHAVASFYARAATQPQPRVVRDTPRANFRSYEHMFVYDYELGAVMKNETQAICDVLNLDPFLGLAGC